MPPRPPGPHAPFRHRLAVAAASLLGALLLLEGVLRLRQWGRYGTFAVTYYELEHDPVTGTEIPLRNSSIGPIHINSLGFRGPELDVPKPPGRIRLAFLGGSTTFCAEVSSEEATWPALVASELAAAHPSTTFDLVNGGSAGHTTSESLLDLRHRIAPLEPDVIVIYHATNDLTHDSRELAEAQGLYDPDPGAGDWLARHWLSWCLVEKNLRFLAAGTVHARTLDFDPRQVSPRFREHLTELVHEARGLAPVVALVTFTHRPRREQSPQERREAARSSLFYMPYLDADAVVAGFAEYNRVIGEVAAATGAVLIAGEDSIPGDEEHFVDSVHLTDAGCARQAQRVAAGLEASPAFQELVTRGGGPH